MKTLRFSILVGAVVLGLASRLQAVSTTINWNSGFANGGLLPEGNTTGWFDTRTVFAALIWSARRRVTV